MRMALKFSVWLRRQREGRRARWCGAAFRLCIIQHRDSLRVAWIRVIISYSVYVHPFDFLIKALFFFFFFFFSSFSLSVPRRVSRGGTASQLPPPPLLCGNCWLFFFYLFPETEVRQVTCPFDTKPWIIDVLAKVLVALQWRRTLQFSMFTVFKRETSLQDFIWLHNSSNFTSSSLPWFAWLSLWFESFQVWTDDLMLMIRDFCATANYFHKNSWHKKKKGPA